MKKNLTYFLLAATALAPSCSKSVDNSHKENNNKIDTVRVIGATMDAETMAVDEKVLNLIDKNSNEYTIHAFNCGNNTKKSNVAFFAERGDTLVVQHKVKQNGIDKVEVLENLTANRLKQEFVRQR